MSEQTTAATGSAEPAADSGRAAESQQEPEKKKAVPYESHKRALDDMFKHKQRAQELEGKLSAIEEERLKEQQNFKALAERYKSEADSSKKEHNQLKDTIVRNQKFSAIEREARQQGIRDEALEDLELLEPESVEIEVTSNNRFMVHGAKEYVETLKQKKPHWFKKDKVPVVNSGGGGAKPPEPKKATVSDLMKAEKQLKMGKISREEYHKVYWDVAQSKNK